MNTKLKALAFAMGTVGFLAYGSSAQAVVIYNTGDATTATIALGINDLGHLNAAPNITSNASATGLAFKFADGTFRDATAPGCLCEGWGVSVNDTIGGGISISNGSGNISLAAPISATSSTATTTARLTSLPGLTVKHEYTPSTNAPTALFRAHVTISNTTGADVTNLRYVRVMDWDVPPTEFSEFVTIQGTATTTDLARSHNNGFSNPNPLAGNSPIIASTLNTDFIDVGPRDHGAYFQFNFGSLANGASQEFDIFYGAAATEAAALAAIGAEGIELFSLGQSRGGAATGTPATFIFGFSGVGGVPVIPPSVPEPGSLALFGAGLALVATAIRRRRKAS